MMRWLSGIAACLVSIAVCHATQAEGVMIDLEGTWTGRATRHVTEQGFVPFYRGLRLVMEDRNGTQFKGCRVNVTGRDETRGQFTGATDLNHEHLYFRRASGDAGIGKITAGNRMMRFVAGSDKETVTVFKLGKTAAP